MSFHPESRQNLFSGGLSKKAAAQGGHDISLLYASSEEAFASVRGYFFTIENQGYDELYVLENGSGFKGEENIIKADHNNTKNKIRNEFRKYVKTKMLNKVVLSKFVDQIA